MKYAINFFCAHETPKINGKLTFSDTSKQYYIYFTFDLIVGCTIEDDDKIQIFINDELAYQRLNLTTILDGAHSIIRASSSNVINNCYNAATTKIYCTKSSIRKNN